MIPTAVSRDRRHEIHRRQGDSARCREFLLPLFTPPCRRQPVACTGSPTPDQVLTQMLPPRRSGRSLIIFAAAIPLMCAIGLYFNWQQDNAVLRKQALAITAPLDNALARIRTVNHWVYLNKGFDK